MTTFYPKVRAEIRKESVIPFPELYLDVFVAPDNETEERLFAELFAQARCRKADSPETADVVIFGGGSDVSPCLYGEKAQDAHNTVSARKSRDDQDQELYDLCIKQGIPMIGICRGAQFLAVMQGAKLIQHMSGHHTPHPVFVTKKARTIHGTPSSHHQCVLDDGKMEVLATANVGTNKFLRRGVPYPTLEGVKIDEVEAYFYRDKCILGFQGHPEYNHDPSFRTYSKYFLEEVEALISHNPDLDPKRIVLEDGTKTTVLRIKDDLLNSPKAEDAGVTQ